MAGILQRYYVDEFLKQYNTTFDDFVKSSGPYPNGFVDCQVYMGTVGHYEQRISLSQTNLERFKARGNVDPHQMRTTEESLMSDTRALYNFVSNVLPINGERFRREFNAILTEQLHLKLEVGKALAKECLEGDS